MRCLKQLAIPFIFIDSRLFQELIRTEPLSSIEGTQSQLETSEVHTVCKRPNPSSVTFGANLGPCQSRKLKPEWMTPHYLWLNGEHQECEYSHNDFEISYLTRHCHSCRRYKKVCPAYFSWTPSIIICADSLDLQEVSSGEGGLYLRCTQLISPC